MTRSCAPSCSDARTELGGRDLVEHGARGGARDRVAAERAAEPAGSRRVHQLRAARDAGERQPAAERLAGDEQVGLDAVVLDRPDRPGPADAGLHLVVDVEDPVPVAELAAARAGSRPASTMKPPSPCTGSSTTHATLSGSTSRWKSSLEPGDRVRRRRRRGTGTAPGAR